VTLAQHLVRSGRCDDLNQPALTPARWQAEIDHMRTDFKALVAAEDITATFWPILKPPEGQSAGFSRIDQTFRGEFVTSA
jgi:hypothetical protein